MLYLARFCTTQFSASTMSLVFAPGRAPSGNTFNTMRLTSGAMPGKAGSELPTVPATWLPWPALSLALLSLAPEKSYWKTMRSATPSPLASGP